MAHINNGSRVSEVTAIYAPRPNDRNRKNTLPQIDPVDFKNEIGFVKKPVIFRLSDWSKINQSVIRKYISDRVFFTHYGTLKILFRQ